MESARVALVTGCSSGIGRATALRLAGAGFRVYASARRLESVADLAAEASGRVVPLRVDVTDEASMRDAVGRIIAETGRIDLLVNNAGFELVGAVEIADPGDVRRQFDTNVLGLVRLTQLVLPAMRERRSGRIINVSSVFGRFAVPGRAFYAASKHAVAAFTEALRLEVAPFGVRVSLVEPTVTRTGLAANSVVTGTGVSRGDDYAGFYRDLARWQHETYGRPARTVAGRLAVTAEAVADAIARAGSSRRPRPRYPVGGLAHALFLLRRWLPQQLFDGFVRSQFPVPKPAPVP